MNTPKRKFLIVKLSSLGDVVYALPFLRTLRAGYPDAYIAWMVEERYRELLNGNPDLDEVIPVRLKHWRKHWNGKTLREISATRRLLKKRGFDWTFDLQGLIKTGILARLTGAPNRAAFHRNNCREKINTWFNNRQSEYVAPGGHVVDLYLSQLSVLGNTFQPKQEFPLIVSAEAERKAEIFMKENPDLTARPIAAINPGAGFPTKLWSLERFAQLADRMTGELGFSILLTWGPGEEKMVKQIADTMRQRYWMAPPTTISESIALYKQLTLFVGCDSGPLHLCAALGVPTVSVWGPTHPARNGAYGAGHQAVYHELPCSFCWKRKCPVGTHECMDRVTGEDVYRAIKTIVPENVRMTVTP